MKQMLVGLDEEIPEDLGVIVSDNMYHGLCMLLTQPASGILHSVVDLMCQGPGVEGQLLSSNDQILGVCSDVAFIEPLICAALRAMSATSDTPLY